MNMMAFIVEEVSDEGSVPLELCKICRGIEDHNGPWISVDELGSAEDMETPTTAMDGRLDNARTRRQVGVGVTRIVGHGEERWCVDGMCGIRGQGDIGQEEADGVDGTTRRLSGG
jgi:hypothetical protein